MSRRVWLVIFAFVLLPAGLALARLDAVGFDAARLFPRRTFHVQTLISFDGHGSTVSVGTFLPASDDRQRIIEERNASPGLTFELERSDGNRLARWVAPPTRKRFDVVYAYEVVPRGVEYVIPGRLPLTPAPSDLEPWLQATAAIQAGDPEIGELLDRLAPPPRFVGETLAAIFRYTSDELETVSFKGTTDALTALRLGRASCNGKSRLFVALARRAGIPARLVGGVILKEGSKRTSHQWVEAWVNGRWVPYCPTNGYAAALPETYLALYRGDEVLFSHSANVNFDYTFKIRRAFLSSAQDPGSFASSVDFWALFRQLGIPIEILRIILMLPIGATVVVVLRNVVGLESYGIFLPVLVAAAARNTGIYWGLLGFGLVLVLTGLLRGYLGRFALLHTPKLAVLFTFVITLILTMAALGARSGLTDVAHVSLFPVAILTMTTERFVLTAEERGFRHATGLMLSTLLAVFVCYRVMDDVGLQTLVLGFPELLLVTVAVNLALARWVGIRLSEYYRFRHLIFGEPRTGDGGEA